MPMTASIDEIIVGLEHEVDRSTLVRLINEISNYGYCDRCMLDSMMIRLAADQTPVQPYVSDILSAHGKVTTFAEAVAVLRKMDVPHGDKPPPPASPALLDKHTSSTVWFRISSLIKQRDGHLCRCCGSGAENGRLIVHCRWHPNRIGGEKLEDLLTLCPRCSTAIIQSKNAAARGRESLVS
jgi:hypothetical protein